MAEEVDAYGRPLSTLAWPSSRPKPQIDPSVRPRRGTARHGPLGIMVRSFRLALFHLLLSSGRGGGRF